MADTESLAQLKLVWRPDLGNDITACDLRDWVKIPDGWIQATADGDQPVDEVLTLNIDGTSHDDLAAQLQAISRKIKETACSRNPMEPNSAWLRTQLKNETNPRQAYVLNVRPGPAHVTSPAIWQSLLYQYQIGLTRTPFWEAITFVSESLLDLNSLGGHAALSQAVVGDVAGRIARLVITPNSPAALKNFWIGIKSDQFGNPANFVSNWPVHQAFVHDSDSSTQADSSAYDGTKLVTTFATNNTLAQRALLKISTFTAYAADQRGFYTVLLRAKMSNVSTAWVRVGYGYTGPAGLFNPVYNERQLISGTSWKLYSLGDVSFPSGPLSAAFTLNNSGLNLQAMRESGSGNLEMDCLIFIPVSDGNLYASVSNAIGYDVDVNLFTQPDGRLTGIADIGGIAGYPVQIDPRSWGIPIGSTAGVLVFAADGTLSDKSYTADISLDYYPRWLTLRGAA